MYYTLCKRAAESNGSCPMGWHSESFNSFCYLYDTVWFRTYDHSVSLCIRKGSQIASILDEEESIFIGVNFIKSGSAWIGLQDIHEEGNYVWQDGIPYNTSSYNRFTGMYPAEDNILLKSGQRRNTFFNATSGQWLTGDVFRYGRDVSLSAFQMLPDLKMESTNKSYYALDSNSCQQSPNCQSIAVWALQHAILKPEKFNDFGTFLQHFSEVFIGNSFHPELIYGENKLFYDNQDPLQRNVYELLTKIGNVVFKSELDISIHELPLLLMPLSGVRRNGRISALSKREEAARYVFHSHVEQWKKTSLEDGATYGFKRELGKMYLILGAGLDVNDMGTNIINTMHRFYDLFPLNPTYNFTLDPTFGKSEVEKLYKERYYGQLIKDSLSIIMQIMKYSSVLGNVAVRDAQFVTEQIVNIKNMGYVMKVESKEQDTKNMMDSGRLDSIVSCETKHDCKDNFDFALTNMGICNVYNGLRASDLYKTSEYLKIFESVFGTGVYNKPERGTTQVVKLILDTHQSEVFGSESGSFSLSINEAIDSFDAMGDNIEFYPGQQVNIAISATLFNTSENVRTGYSIDERLCRYKDEDVSPQSIFKQYSQKSCMFECGLRNTTNTLNCAPWNFLHISEGLEICTRDEVKEFEELIISSQQSKTCRQNCPDNCESVKFSPLYDVHALDIDILCSSQLIVDLTMKTLETPTDLAFWKMSRLSKWQELSFGSVLPITELARCREKVLQDFAFVKIYMPKEKIIYSVKSRKYEFVDMLGIFGGTFGLFTGFSLSSAVEIAYWLWILITRLSGKIVQ